MRYMNYDLAAQELIRALRGERSQVAMNRRLGRRSNVTHAWETGVRQPRASDFLKMLEVSGRPPLRVLEKFAPVSGATAKTLVRSWLRALWRDRPRSELARRLGVNRNTVARWLRGDTEPRLAELLAFVEVTTHRVLDFIAELVDPERVPSIRRAFCDLRAQRALAYEMPWAHVVLRALELDGYRALPRHEPGFIATRTGISLEEEERCLSALARARQIRRRRGLYRVARVLAVDTREDPAKNAALKRHWSEVAVQRLGASGAPADGLCSYNLFAISEAGLERVRQAHLDYYELLRAIVADCKGPTRLVLATLQLVPLDGGRPEGSG
jgi:transcriptional regulator with XRE-family HTH domain